MGILIALFFMIIELAEVGASYVGALTLGGDYAGYTPIDTITPALYLSPLSLAGLWAWRRGFTLKPRGVHEGPSERINIPKEV
jgi:hypothetical protein